MATASSTAAPKVNPSFATGFNEPCPKIIKLKTNVKINNAAIATVLIFPRFSIPTRIQIMINPPIMTGHTQFAILKIPAAAYDPS